MEVAGVVGADSIKIIELLCKTILREQLSYFEQCVPLLYFVSRLFSLD